MSWRKEAACEIEYSPSCKGNSMFSKVRGQPSEFGKVVALQKGSSLSWLQKAQHTQPQLKIKSVFHSEDWQLIRLSSWLRVISREKQKMKDTVGKKETPKWAGYNLCSNLSCHHEIQGRIRHVARLWSGVMQGFSRQFAKASDGVNQYQFTQVEALAPWLQ